MARAAAATTAPATSSRPTNGWQQLRAFAELGVVVADVLSLQSHICDVLQDHGFSAKQQPASKVPRYYPADEMLEESDAESVVDAREDDDDDRESTANICRCRPEVPDRRSLGMLTAVIGLRPLSGKPTRREDDFRSTGIVIKPVQAAKPPAGTPEDKERQPRPRTRGKGGRRSGKGRRRKTSPASDSDQASTSSSPGRSGDERIPGPPQSEHPAVPLALPLVHEVHKRHRRGMGGRHRSRALLSPAQKAVAKQNDKARRLRNRPNHLHAILMASETTQRRMRSQTEQAARDRRIAAPKMLALLRATSVVSSDVPIQRMMHGSSFFTNTYHVRPEEQGHSTSSSSSTLHPRCNRMVRDLLEKEGYTYVVNDLGHVSTVTGARPNPVRGPAPKPPPWQRLPEHQTYARALSRFTFGASHGGGQKKPTRIAPDWTKHNERLIIAFLREPAVVSIICHLESCVFTWLPDVAAFYKKLEANIEIPEALRTSRCFNLPFAAHTFNLGPYVQCWFHRDARN
ncbi:hypothetical protein AURDEDRAFT_168810 [Auricularia subglabra TFB-10046 SS5]|nr:hypothetical protein AURDEDRAFT_168810 [Auricularia subglabra TFB-10046 SS5]